MKAIIVDDEPIMVRKFARLSSQIPDLLLIGQFESATAALNFARKTPIDVAFLDVSLPQITGIAVAEELRDIDPEILIVFVTAYDDYVWDFNKIGGDYYILKPYTSETLEMAMERLRLLYVRKQKDLYLQMFGRFVILQKGKPLPITGKAKEILALVATKRGKEISNEEIYSTLWEYRPYGNYEMTVYYNALRRLKIFLKKHDISDLLISTQRGQMVNVSVFDCDYYAWMDNNLNSRYRFEGEFLTEYSWAEPILANILFQ